jgi:hypothetical protein
MKKLITIASIYLGAFGICLGSYALLVRFGGNRGSNLGWAVVSLSEFIRHSFGLNWEAPGNAYNISTLLACGLIALVFLGAFALVTAQHRFLRMAGFGSVAVLLYLTFYWFRTPLNRF